MVQLITGKKGKGKTKILLEMANKSVAEAKGSIVYLDKSAKHMYELNREVRLIDVSEYGIASSDAFVGFICGILSQNHDIEYMFLDSFLKLSGLEGADVTAAIESIKEIGDKYGINFVISISEDKENLSASVQEYIVTAL